MLYTKEQKAELEEMVTAFGDYIKASEYLELFWSDKIGYILLKISIPSRSIPLNRNFLNLGIIESRNYIRISYGSFLYAGTNGISPFS